MVRRADDIILEWHPGDTVVTGYMPDALNAIDDMVGTVSYQVGVMGDSVENGVRDSHELALRTGGVAL